MADFLADRDQVTTTTPPAGVHGVQGVHLQQLQLDLVKIYTADIP